jgi:para-nitrobenzyl esterase
MRQVSREIVRLLSIATTEFFSLSVILIVMSIVMVMTAPASAQTVNQTVKIDVGQLEGIVSGDVLSFKGISYAEPPVGDLRWREPQLVKPWQGMRKASEYGFDCVQKPIPGDSAASGAAFGEDCLKINVWRPAASKSDEKLPVMVWIHGGGFLNGGSSAAIFDGSAMARQGLVFVSLNYRLGRLGFFAYPALTVAKEGPLGNYAFMDQLAALRWVKRNIGAFGGNPERVTIVGESAGGISVMHLLTWPEARGLFHRAVVLSGGGRTYLVGAKKLSGDSPGQPSAEESGIEFAKSMGIIGTDAAALSALRRLPVEKVNGDLSMEALLTKPKTFVGGPIIDGAIVSTTPGEVLNRGEAVKVPLIIGTTSQDLPVEYPPSKDNPLSFFGPEAAKAKALYDPSGKLPPPAVAAAIAVDLTMHEPARFVARRMTAQGNPVWLYRFGYVAESLRPKGTGAQHSSELPYLFKTLDARLGKDVAEKDRAVAEMFHSYIANFAKVGDPNSAGLPSWPKYDPAKFDLMMFTPDGEAKMQPDPWAERLTLVERVKDSKAGSTGSQSSSAGLAGTSWQMVKFEGSDGTTLTPDDKSKYTVTFGSDGRVSVRIDCNRGHGTWKSAGANNLQFGPLALTRAMCPANPVTDRWTKDFMSVRSYVMKDGHLFLSLMADGGAYEFEPISVPAGADQSGSGIDP